MVKIALVNPKKIKKYITSAAPPINLGYLASYLKKYAKNIEVKIIDGLAGQNIEKELLKFNPDVVGVTSTTPTILEAYRIANFVRNSLTNTLVIMGGVHVSVMPEEALKYVDVVVIGEGEVALLEIVQKIARGERVEEKIIDRPYILNLDEVPSPAWDLMDMEFYILAEDNTARTIPYTSSGVRAITLVSSRGCPYHCIFCHNSWRPSPARYHSAEHVVSEIEFLIRKYKINSFFFADDEFLINSERLKKICWLLIERGLNKKITWGCQARSDAIERVGLSVLRLVKRAGCSLMAIGFESGSQRVLNLLKKDLTVENHQKAIKFCQSVGLKISGSFMFGTPGETKQDMLMTCKFIEDNKDKLDLIGIGVTTPYPGTKLWQICLEQNLIQKNIDYTILCPDPRFGLTDEQIICDTMSKREFRKLFKFIQNQTREINFSKRVEDKNYSFSKVFKFFLSHPFYVFYFILRRPRRFINLLKKMLKKIF